MKRLAVLAVGAGVAAAAAYGVATAYSGHQLQKALLAQPRQWARVLPFVEVHELKYDKRFFDATRTTTLKLGCPGSAPLMLTWRDTVRHGPLPGFTSIGSAAIESELVLTDEQRAELKRVTGSDAAPLTARTMVDLGGGSTTDLDVVRFSLPLPQGGVAAWQGLQARWQAPANGAASYELKMPGFELTDPAKGVALKFSGLAVRGEGLPLPGLWWAMAGKGSGELKAFDVSARPAAPGVPALAFSLRDVKLVGDAKIDDGELYHATSTISGRGEVGGAKIDKFEMQASMKRLHAPSYELIMASLIGASCDPSAMQSGSEALQKALLQLLPHNPEYALDRFVVQHAGKQASLSYSAAVNGITEAELRGAIAPALMAKSTFRLDLSVPAAWFEQMAAGLPAGPGGAAPPAGMVDGLVQQGIVRRDGEMLAVSAQFAQGSLQVNGRPIPLPGSPP